MEDNNNPFKKAGIVLLIIGIIDVGIMAYCIANKISYSSSFNIFAVIAGVFLIKGRVKTARAVHCFSAFPHQVIQALQQLQLIPKRKYEVLRLSFKPDSEIC